MFCIIAGGGNMGYYLLHSRLDKKNEVVIIEKDRGRCQCLLEEFGSLVVQGDACDPMILERAGIARADIILAVTGKDQDNLIICQLARKKFRVPSTIALVNNPSNGEIFRRLGVDEAVSSIDAVLEKMEKPIEQSAGISVISRHGPLNVCEIRLHADSPAMEKTPGQLKTRLPREVQMLCIIRQGEALPADDKISLLSEDILLMTSPGEHLENIRSLLVRDVSATDSI